MGCRRAAPQNTCADAQVGQRGYYAVRQLKLAGHDAVNIMGGWKSFKDYNNAGLIKVQPSKL